MEVVPGDGDSAAMSARLRNEHANPAEAAPDPVPKKDGMSPPAWDNNQFTCMMQSELLSYSLAVSVGPLAKVIEVLGTTLHKHDDTLQHLLVQSVENADHLAQTNQVVRDQADELENHMQDAIQSLRADLLALIHPLEAKTAAADAAIQGTAQQVEALRSSAAMSDDGGGSSSSRRPDEGAVADLAKRLDELEVRLGRQQEATKDEPHWKNEMEQSMQAQLNAMQQYMQSEFDSERQRIQDILNSHDNNSIGGRQGEGKQHSMTPLPPLHRAQSHPSGLQADAPDLPSKSNAEAAHKSNAMDGVANIHQRLDQEEQMLEALRQQYEALQEIVDQVQADTRRLAERLATGGIVNISDPSEVTPLVGSSSFPTIAIDDVASPHNGVMEMEVTRQATVLDGLNKDVRDLQAQRSARQRDLDKHLNSVDKHLRDLAAADVVHTSLMDTHKTSVQKVKADVAKVAADLQSLVDNQALMQGFQSTTGGAPDLSMVFAKLAEMRQAQTDATATLQANLDALVERQTIHQDGLDGLISNVDVLNSKVGTHDSALNSRDDRDASVAKLMARQLEAQVNYQKDAVQRGLHVQERVLTTLLDLMQRVAELRQDVDKGEKGAEIQNLFQVFHHMGPQIAQVLALPPLSHEALQRIAHAIDVNHLAPEEARGLADTVNETHQMLSSLEQHNNDMIKQQGHSRTQLDELWHAWNAKMHMDMLGKITILSKELRELIKHGPTRQPSTTNHVAKSNQGGMSDADSKVLETKLVSTNRRLNDIEDTLRAVSKNLMAYKHDMNDKVTAGNLSKLKFQVFSELAKIHAVLGSARFQGGAPVPAAQVLDDSEIKSSLDDQAELIASLCNDLKQSLADKATDDAAAAAGGARHSLSRLSNDNDPFNAKLEAITEKVAELFLSLELNRSNAQPRHAIPTYNPAQMLDSFAQNIEAKLAESQSLNRKQIHDIKDELNDLVRQRVAKALESMQFGPVDAGDGTTAGGSKPVVCIACSRPVKLETNIQGLLRCSNAW
ncbi:hypothetical protein, variant [Aphanomyces astaci]|uniref:Uncharacterized protein n=1 Tax=Aphanomyces astaci TaxID=112090 RepID=W4G4Q0_APHAT|nr:hypothetical protein, variant [Aphanomyces astaci]ETV74645.1 hypothetical protein, variant [Aphanomyces astaci]|eukprot:XP_009835732.1 hypothetical protein, variant [Aphanomyces astaci]